MFVTALGDLFVLKLGIDPISTPGPIQDARHHTGIRVVYGLPRHGPIVPLRLVWHGIHRCPAKSLGRSRVSLTRGIDRQGTRRRGALLALARERGWSRSGSSSLPSGLYIQLHIEENMQES